MKVLKMKPEYLQRHMLVNKYSGNSKLIFTIRDEEKGSIGDEFRIEGLFVPYQLNMIRQVTLTDAVNDWYDNLGFESEDEAQQEIQKLYPGCEQFFIHMLKEMN